jgi:hypothetical protein
VLLRGVVAAVSTAVALTLTATVPASAARDTFTDRHNDARRGVDIRTVTVVNEDRIVVRTTFDWLSRRGSTGLSVYFDTNRRNHGPEYAAVGGLYDGTDWQALRVDGWNDRTPRLLLRCDIDLRVRHGRGGQATYDLARKCLRDPGDIRVTSKSGGPGRNDWAPRHQTFYPTVAWR